METKTRLVQKLKGYQSSTQLTDILSTKGSTYVKYVFLSVSQNHAHATTSPYHGQIMEPCIL